MGLATPAARDNNFAGRNEHPCLKRSPAELISLSLPGRHVRYDAVFLQMRRRLTPCLPRQSVACWSWRVVLCWVRFGTGSSISALAASTHPLAGSRRDKSKNRRASRRYRSWPQSQSHLSRSAGCASSVRRMHAVSLWRRRPPNPALREGDARYRRPLPPLPTAFKRARGARRHGTMGTRRVREARAPARSERNEAGNDHARCPDLGRPR